MNHQNLSKSYSVYVKSKVYGFIKYFIFITNENIYNIEDKLIINNINHDLAVLIYNYIKNKYGKIKFEIGRTNELILKYEDIKNIFNDIQNDIIANNITKYEDITKNKTILVLSYISTGTINLINFKHSTYLHLFETDNMDINTMLNERKINEYEDIYKYWISNNSYLTYHYIIQKYAYKNTNKLSLSTREANGKIEAFLQNI